MSRIYFHSPSGDAEVSGTERAWMGCLVDDIGAATVDGGMLKRLDEWCEVWLYGKRVKDLLISSSNRDGLTYAVLAERAKLAARFDREGSGERTGVWYRDRQISMANLTANAAMLIGAPHVQLVVRLHNQCEIHCWVDGPNRAWLADLIGAGLRAGTFRNTVGRSGGWGDVVELLRSRDDEPVVASYSVTDGFPDPGQSTWQRPADDPDADGWCDLTNEEQWAHGMAWLRARPGWLELRPEHFGTPVDSYHFGLDGLSWLDLEHWDAEDRVRTTLGLDTAKEETRG